MTISMLRRIALSTAAGAVLLGAMSTAHAQTAPEAQAAERAINVPAGPLSQSILTLSGQAGVQIVAEAGSLSSVNGQAVRGSMTFDAAMDQLLAGTGLGWRWLRPGVATIEQNSIGLVQDDGSRLLGPVRVEGGQLGSAFAGRPTRGDGLAQLGGVRGGQDEEARGYRPVVATVGGGSPMALEDIPRSISVISQDQMVSQDIRDIGEALARLPGVTLRPEPVTVRQSATTYVRGFALERYQVDGGAGRTLDQLGNGLLNLDAYERVELVRGPNGAFGGSGSPGGSLNLIRKRPGATEALAITAGAGSFDRRELQLDYQSPSVLGSPLAFRGVASARETGAFYDNYNQFDVTLYGLVDAPLGEKARLELGGQFAQLELNGGYQGIPHYVDGPRLDVPFDFNYSPDFAFSDVRTLEVFSRFYMEILEDLDFEFGLSYQDQNSRDLNVQAAHGLTSTGGSLYTGMISAFYGEQDPSQFGFDLKLTGKAETFGFSHSFYAGYSFNERDDGAGGGTSFFYGSRPVDSLADFDPEGWPSLTPSTFDLFSAGSGSDSAIILSDVISWRDKIELSLTLRRDTRENSNIYILLAQDGTVSTFELSELTDRSKNEGEWIPSWALTYKPIDGLSLYVSRSEGFSRQDNLYYKSGTAPNFTYQALDPIAFDNLEVGLKYGRENWLFSAAIYRLLQDNVGVGTDDLTCPPLGNPTSGFTGTCHKPDGATTESTGLDVELVGELLPGVNVQMSYNWIDLEASDPQLSLAPIPENEAKLFVDWRPAFLPNWQFRGGLRYRDATFAQGQRDLYTPPPENEYFDTIDFAYTAEAHTVLDLGATYRISKKLTADLFVENVTDEAYFMSEDRNFSFPGRPRSIFLTLKWQDAGAEDGPSPTNGLAPFGDPANWYGAFDLGGHQSRDLDATAEGKAQDLVSAVNWTFETEDKQAAFVRLGYRLDSAWRVEAEAGARTTEFGDIGGGAVAPFGVCGAYLADDGQPFDCDQAQGDADMWTLMLNVLHDFGAEDARWRPFVGVGAGVVRSSIDFSGKMEGIGSTTTPWAYFDQLTESIGGDSTRMAFAWQAQAGLSFNLTDRAIIEATYRYFNAPALTWDSYNAETSVGFPPFFVLPALTPRLGEFEADYEDHALTIGLRWAFGAR